jgi:hypothetical protein
MKWAAVPWWRGQTFNASSPEQRKGSGGAGARSSGRQALIALP